MSVAELNTIDGDKLNPSSGGASDSVRGLGLNGASALSFGGGSYGLRCRHGRDGISKSSSNSYSNYAASIRSSLVRGLLGKLQRKRYKAAFWTHKSDEVESGSTDTNCSFTKDIRSDFAALVADFRRLQNGENREHQSDSDSTFSCEVEVFDRVSR